MPVLKEYDNRQAQLRMEQFLSFSTRFAKIRSKRLQTAVANITGHEPVEGGFRGLHEFIGFLSGCFQGWHPGSGMPCLGVELRGFLS